MELDNILQMIITIITAVLASSGLWAYINTLGTKKEFQKQLLLALVRNEIVEHALTAIQNGYISDAEFGYIHEHLFTPYKNMGGNGVIIRLMSDLERLPIHHIVSSDTKPIQPPKRSNLK